MSASFSTPASRLSSPRIEPLEARIAPATFLVTSFADHGAGTLRDAIDHANSSPGADTIAFKTGGTIKLLSALPAITDDLTIIPTKAVTINGQGKVQLLQILGDGTDVSLGNLKLINGVAENGGALSIDAPNGTISIAKSVFNGNRAVAQVDAYGNPVGLGWAGGGAIVNFNGSVNIESSELSANQASSSVPGAYVDGGAILNYGSLTISKGTLFSKNTATGDQAAGGAITNMELGSVSLDKVTFLNNSANGMNGAKGSNGAAGAAGVDPGAGGDPGESGTEGGDGGAASGGAIKNFGSMTITASKISGNTAAGGNGGVGGNGGAGGAGAKGAPAYTYNGYQIPAGERGWGGDGGDGANGGHAGSADGGAISNETGATLTISNTEISNNTAKTGTVGLGGKAGAGGAGSMPGTPGLPGEAGSGGEKSSGGGIRNSGTATLESVNITKNSVFGGDAAGGGIHNDYVLSVSKSTISLNSVKAGNGGNGNAGIKGANGANGLAGEKGDPGQDGTGGQDGDTGGDGTDGGAGTDGGVALGGGIYNAGVVTVLKSTVSGNTVISGNGGNGGNGGKGGNGGAGGAGGAGGPGYTAYGTSYPAGHRGLSGQPGYAGNGGMGGDAGSAGDAAGGGIFSGYNSFAVLTVSDSTISGNKTTAGAPGKAGLGGKAGTGRIGETYAPVDGADGAQPIVSLGDGGGIFSDNGTLALSQVTVALNVASANGGGIAVEASSAATVHNSTIAKNSAATGGGLFVALGDETASVEVISSIIGANLAGVDKDASGPVAATASLIGVDPLLSRLAFHGGSTQTMLPLTGSPALNLGSNPDSLVLDQRGSPRVQGPQIDIGAVEVG